VKFAAFRRGTSAVEVDNGNGVVGACARRYRSLWRRQCACAQRSHHSALRMRARHLLAALLAGSVEREEGNPAACGALASGNRPKSCGLREYKPCVNHGCKTSGIFYKIVRRPSNARSHISHSCEWQESSVLLARRRQNQLLHQNEMKFSVRHSGLFQSQSSRERNEMVS
jgi:hypothetical protein